VLLSFRRRTNPYFAHYRFVAASLALVLAFGACVGDHLLEGEQSLDALDATTNTLNGPAGGLSFYHPNHLGSSSVVTDGTVGSTTYGHEQSRMLFTPFGELVQSASVGKDIVTRKYTGQESDEELGLHYYNGRYYDSSLGRFISP